MSKFSFFNVAPRRRFCHRFQPSYHSDLACQISPNRLSVEILEDRFVLSAIGINVNLLSDNGAVPGSAIVGDSVQVGDTFFVEVTAQDLSPFPSGITELGIDIQWDAAAFNETDSPFYPVTNTDLVTGSLSLFRGGTLDNPNGQIGDLRGSSHPAGDQGTAIGETMAERFALLRFQATAAVTNSPFNITISSTGVGFASGGGLENTSIEPQTITVTRDSTASELSIADVSVTEGEMAMVTVSLSPPKDSEVIVRMDTANGSATHPSDYGLVGTILSFDPLQTEKTVSISTNDDWLIEGAEEFQVDLSNPYNAVIADGTGIVTIEDNDTATIGFVASDSSVMENTTAHTLEIVLDTTSSSTRPGELAQDVSVDVADMLAGSAINPYDYTFVGSPVIRFASGDTDGMTGQVTLSIADDSLVEGPETIDLSLVNLRDGTMDQVSINMATHEHHVTITDNDAAELRFVQATSSTTEDNSPHQDELELAISGGGTLGTSISVDVVDLGTGTANSPLDYVQQLDTVTFNVGSSDGTRSRVDFSIVDDDVIELTETINLQLQNVQVSTGVVAEINPMASHHVVSILDNEIPQISIDDVTVTEGETATVNISLSEPSSAVVVVQISSVNGSAVAPYDYQPVATTLLHFAAGVTNQQVTVSAINDTMVEGTEQFSLQLSHPDDVEIIEDTGTVTILDNDRATIGFVSATSSIIEMSGDHAIGVHLTTITNPAGGNTLQNPVTIEVLDLLSGNAVTPADYVFASPQQLTFPKGSSNGTTFNVFLAVVDDPLEEVAETVNLTMQNLSSSLDGQVAIDTSRKEHEVSILDDQDIDPRTAGLSGSVFVDWNNNGVQETSRGEIGISGAFVALAGQDSLGNSVQLDVMTNHSGTYEFVNLMAGDYEITESQPGAFVDGSDRVGTQGGQVMDDYLFAIQLAPGQQGVENLFGELGFQAGFISKRLFLASSRPGVHLYRELNALAADLEGDSERARQIREGTVPSSVSAHPILLSHAVPRAALAVLVVSGDAREEFTQVQNVSVMPELLAVHAGLRKNMQRGQLPADFGQSAANNIPILNRYHGNDVTVVEGVFDELGRNPQPMLTGPTNDLQIVDAFRQSSSVRDMNPFSRVYSFRLADSPESAEFSEEAFDRVDTLFEEIDFRNFE